MAHHTLTASLIAVGATCLACVGNAPEVPEAVPDVSTPQAPVAPTTTTPEPATAARAVTEDDTVAGTPFLGDAVSTADLTSAGWSCAANEIGNMDCSRTFEHESLVQPEISLLLTPDSHVSMVNVRVSDAKDASSDARTLAAHITRLAIADGYTCGVVDASGSDTTCEGHGKTLVITRFGGDSGYAMASVRDPALEGQMAD